MNEKRRNALMIRWSIIASVIIATIWLICHFVFSWTPSSEIILNKNLKFQLPFGDSLLVSFISYILVCPTYLTTWIYFMYKVKKTPFADDFIRVALIGMFTGFMISSFYVFGVLSALAMSILSFISYGAVIGFFTTIIMSIITKNTTLGAVSGSASSWSYTLIASLFLSPIVGTITAFFFNIAVFTAFGITHGIKYFFQKNNFGLAIKEWFLARK